MKISRILSFITLCVIMYFFGAFSTSAADVLQNAGFETWSGGMPDYWTNGNPLRATVTDETTTIHGGTHSLKLERNDTGDVWIQQLVAINGGNDYSFSCWAYDNDANVRVLLLIRFLNISGEFIEAVYSPSSSVDSGNWQELAIATTTAPANAVSAEFQLRFYEEPGWAGSAVAYIDDASMRDLIPPLDVLIRIIDSDSIEITFDEDVEQTSSETTTNYSVDNSVGNPLSATRDSLDHEKVRLDFSAPLPTSSVLSVNINCVEDIYSNPTNNLTAKFLANIRSPGDVDSVNALNGEQVYDDTYATVRGIVIATEFYPQNINIADGITRQGIEARDNAGPISGVTRGDQVVVAGKIGQSYGMAQIQGAPLYIIVESSGNPEPAPLHITLTEVTNQDEEGANAFSGESYEGSLVELLDIYGIYLLGDDRAGGSFDDDHIWDPDANYELCNHYHSGVMRIYSGTDIDGTMIFPIPTCAYYRIRGILRQYKNASPFNSGYSICPRSRDDITSYLSNVQSPWNLYE